MSNQPTVADELSADLLRQAAEWRLLGLLFEPPQGDWRQELLGLAAEAGDQRLATAARQAQEEATADLYHSTLGPGGPARPREVSHHVTLTPGGLLSELQAYYDAFGYQPTCRETPDHVAVEIGFVAFLLFKQAYALACGQTEQAEVAAEAASRFRAEHLAKIAEPLATSLCESGIQYFATAAEVLRERITRPNLTE